MCVDRSHALVGAHENHISRAACEESIGDHADDIVDSCLEICRIDDAHALDVEDHIAVVGGAIRAQAWARAVAQFRNSKNDLYPPLVRCKPAGGNGFFNAPGFEIVDVEINAHDPKPGDIFMLMSDGLSGMVEDKFMEAIMQKQATNLEAAAKKLLDTANANGGVDNSTVILVKYEGA